MGLTSGSTHLEGRQQVFFAKAEVANGTFIKPTATDAVKIHTTDFSHEIASEPIVDNSAYRYNTETIQDKETNTFSVNAYLIPSGTAATEPDLGPFLTSLMGANNSGGSSKWIYTVSNSQAWQTLSMLRYFPNSSTGSYSESLWGSVVQSGKFSLSGGSQPMVTFDGVAMGYARTVPTTLNGAMAASTTMVVATAGKNYVSAGSVISIGANNDILVTVDTSRPSFTVDTSTSADTASAVVPYAPTPTYVGSPIAGTLGSVTMDSGSYPVQSVEVAINNNHEIFTDEAFAQRFSDFAPNKLDCSLTIGMRLREDMFGKVSDYREFATKVLNVTYGSTAGRRYKFDFGYGEQKAPKISFPADKEGTVQIVYNGLGSGATGPLTITHD